MGNGGHVKEKKPVDEVRVMVRMVKDIEGMSVPQQERVLQYVLGRLGYDFNPETRAVK